jgi:hypothetical protein
MGSFRERPVTFAPARAEAFKRAQEPDRHLASPATTRGVLFLSRRRVRGTIGPRAPTSQNFPHPSGHDIMRRSSGTRCHVYFAPRIRR